MSYIQQFLKWFKIMPSFSLKSLGEERLVKCAKLFSLNIKSINPIQKYPHITELFSSILKIFACIFLLPINYKLLLERVQLQNCQNR